MNALNAGLYSALTGTAITTALGGTSVYHLQAPDGQDLPYVIFSWQGGGQTNLVPKLTDVVEFIRVYATSAAQAGTIDTLIQTALDNAPLTVTGWSNILIQREDEYETVENLPSGEFIYTVGGMYRIILD